MLRPTPEFFYFDLGRVLLDFDLDVACRRIAETAGIAADRVREIVYENDLELRFERGEISPRDFYESFCRQAGARPDYDRLWLAASDIFHLHAPVVPIVAALRDAGYRLGLLSNTNCVHWDFVANRRFAILHSFFDVHALSFQIGAVKPERAIYEAAERLAAASRERIFFVDDREDNVEAARQYGFDAVLFVSALHLAAQLRDRGVQFNY